MLSPYPDKSLIRNALTYTLGEEMGLQAPGWRHVEVMSTLTANHCLADDYQGVYLLVEKRKYKKTDLT
jgi:hypothetical protein